MGAGHKIKRVLPGGIAEEMGVEPGMSIIAVNGQEIQDVFDYQYLMEDLHVEILIREENGEETLIEVDRDPDEDFGVEFETSLMDDYKSCCNRCIFCFI
ncbi:MAG: PDZ domain-containing protein, partial [Lachnospiraceae bacterium]|nr:PDZ domain-containing protein [Lachnospiraceae bacterium]